MSRRGRATRHAYRARGERVPQPANSGQPNKIHVKDGFTRADAPVQSRYLKL